MNCVDRKSDGSVAIVLQYGRLSTEKRTTVCLDTAVFTYSTGILPESKRLYEYNTVWEWNAFYGYPYRNLIGEKTEIPTKGKKEYRVTNRKFWIPKTEGGGRCFPVPARDDSGLGY